MGFFYWGVTARFRAVGVQALALGAGFSGLGLGGSGIYGFRDLGLGDYGVRDLGLGFRISRLGIWIRGVREYDTAVLG